MNLAAGDVEAVGVLETDIEALKRGMRDGRENDVEVAANLLLFSLDNVVARGSIGGLNSDSVTVAGAAGTVTSPYPMMLDATLTGRFGYRFLTEEMAAIGVGGNAFELGTFKHTAADFSSVDGRFVAAFDGLLGYAGGSDSKGLGISLTTTDKEGATHELRYYHNDPEAIEYFARAVLATGDFTIPGGTVIGGTGERATGVGTNPHLHVEYLIDGEPSNPLRLGGQGKLYAQESEYSRRMSGIAPQHDGRPTDRYLDLDLLTNLEAYSRSREPDYFRDYMKHHTGYAFDSVNEYLGYLNYLNQSGVTR